MPSKIPTYSVFPNNSPDTDYEQDYETPAPGPPPTRLLFKLDIVLSVEIMMMTITRPARRGTATQLSTNIPYTRRPSGFLYRSLLFSLSRLQIYFVKDTSL